MSHPQHSKPPPIGSSIPAKTLTLTGSSFTHQGLIRTGNEDRQRVDLQNHFAIIADGMGGHAAGEIASQLAIEIIGNEIITHYNLLYEHVENEKEDALIDKFIEIVQTANTSIFSAASQNSQHHGMGTTLDAVIFFRQEAFVLHVGDSRVYQIREPQVVQITLDHSLAAVLIESGKATQEQAKDFSNILLRALGTQPKVETDIYRMDIESGDRFLMCTDGVWEYVPEAKEILDFSRLDLELASEKFVQISLERGGKDNATAIVLATHLT